LRLALFVSITGLLSWGFGTHYILELTRGLWQFVGSLGAALAAALFFAFVYLALEPFVRRRAPELLIGWARVVEGRFRDPRVGRDVLVGAAYGAVIALVIHITNALPTWFSLGGQTTIPPETDMVQGGRLMVAALFGAPLGALGQAMSVLGVFFLLLLVFRNRVAATIGLALVTTMIRIGGENFALEAPGALIFGTLIALMTARFGLLATFAGGLFGQLLIASPLPLDLGAAYAPQTIIVLFVLVALVLVALRISLGPRPVFGFALDD
jgi:serine/threonine-protein kinase